MTSGGPRSHSASSHSSRPLFSSPSYTQRQPQRTAAPPSPPRRPRVNQPLGYVISETFRPAYYYGRRHDYVYYPESWTDASTGTRYEKGYYDENGERYDSVAFSKDGKFENVMCHCSYCGQDSILDLTVKEAGVHKLQCPHCGGPRELVSELDEYVSQAPANTHIYASEESLRKFRQPPKKKSRWWIIAVLLLVFSMFGNVGRRGSQNSSVPQQSQQTQQIELIGQDLAGHGDTIVLTKTGPASYSVSSLHAGDKTLVWDPEADSYYDAETQCWLWYNTDVEPPLWQYWYEGISSEYDESGWMEHEDTGWFIESSPEKWIELPEVFDASRLWYIE